MHICWSVTYVADVVGVTLGLKELWDVWRQGVLLMDLLQASLIKDL